MNKKGTLFKDRINNQDLLAELKRLGLSVFATKHLLERKRVLGSSHR